MLSTSRNKSQILLVVKTVFISSRNEFFTDSLFRLVEMDFLSNGDSIPLFRALFKFLKFGGSNFFERHIILACGN